MSNTTKKKTNWQTTLIIIGLVIIAGWILISPTGSKDGDSNGDPSVSGYSREMQKAADLYSLCIKNSESAPSNQRDALEGTNLSRENLSSNERDACLREYNLRKRVIENKY